WSPRCATACSTSSPRPTDEPRASNPAHPRKDTAMFDQLDIDKHLVLMLLQDDGRFSLHTITYEVDAGLLFSHIDHGSFTADELEQLVRHLYFEPVDWDAYSSAFGPDSLAWHAINSYIDLRVVPTQWHDDPQRH